VEKTGPSTPETPPAHIQLIQMGLGYWVSRVVYAAAKLGLADLLAEGPKSAAELADATGADAPSLHRLMRALAGLGILAAREGHRFALTTLGEALRTDAPGAARSSLMALAGEMAWRGWGEILHSLETGKTGFEKAFGVPVFDYLARHPDDAAHFSQAMVGFHGGEPPTVAAAYDFSRFGTVVDVGGSSGNMLVAILERYAGPRGVLFDLPHVVRDAPAFFEARGLGGRVSIASGSFFERIPGGGDAYVLSHIIHDWSEDQCLTILRHCRQAMAAGGRLLIVETVLPEGDEPHPGRMLDMIMMVLPGGQERTEAEYAELLRKAGFRLARVVPTESDVSVVEAVPA